MVSRDELAGYEGREQAYVKHELLQTYLERFMMILGQHFPRVLYVDCFAGPWRSAKEDFQDTSFGRAVRIIKGCREALFKLGRRCEFKALFIERDSEAFARLSIFACQASEPGVTIEAWQGEFQNRIDDVASWIGSDFAFVLIDPKGYCGLIEPAVLAPLLKKRNVEALINYMWQFISLAVGHLDSSAHQGNLLALYGNGVLDIASIPQLERENHLLKMYRRRLVEESSPGGPWRTRTVSFPVEYPGQTNTKYFLIHVTHNDLGVIKFAEASRVAAATQNSVRFWVQQEKKEMRTGIADLFGEGDAQIAAGDRDLVQPWLDLLPEVGAEILVGESVVARLVEENDCFVSELQRGLSLLIKKGVVRNLDMKRQRPKNVLHYEGKGERLRRIE